MNQWTALGLTLVCEVPVMLLLTRMQPAMRPLIVAIVATAASCLTHPVAWRIASVLSHDEYRIGFWLIEAGVVLFEAIWYRLWLRTGFGRALCWSLFANAASLSVGYLLWHLR